MECVEELQNVAREAFRLVGEEGEEGEGGLGGRAGWWVGMAEGYGEGQVIDRGGEGDEGSEGRGLDELLLSYGDECASFAGDTDAEVEVGWQSPSPGSSFGSEPGSEVGSESGSLPGLSSGSDSGSSAGSWSVRGETEDEDEREGDEGDDPWAAPVEKR